jgi:hypothetical protein
MIRGGTADDLDGVIDDRFQRSQGIANAAW